MEKVKRKNDTPDLHRYWRFFLPLTVVLGLMVKFPLCIDMRESLCDALFYGTISTLCVLTAARIYYRAGQHGYRLIAVIGLCSLLSAWQLVDPVILRDGGSFDHSYGSATSIFEPLHEGGAWYFPHFPRDDIQCHKHYERYFGNHMIAIVLEIKRDATWAGCGG